MLSSEARPTYQRYSEGEIRQGSLGRVSEEPDARQEPDPRGAGVGELAERFALRWLVTVPHRAASGQLEAIQVPASPPVLQHPDERRRSGAVEAVARAPRGRSSLVVVVARGTAFEERHVHPRQ